MSRISTSAFRSFGALSGGEPDYERLDLPLGAIDPHPGNRPIDPQRVEELAATIERDGLGQLPLVRAMPNGRYQMIAGHHRLAAYKLLDGRSGDGRWSRMPVNAMAGCDDEHALCLLHMTNLAVAGLSKAEAGRAYEAIARVVRKERKEDPERFAGVTTNQVVADISASQGKPVSATYVRTALKEYRESASPRKTEARQSVLATPRESDLAADALQRAIERLDTLDKSELEHVAQRLARYSRRLRSLVRECGK